MSFNAIRENKILAKISESTVFFRIALKDIFATGAWFTFISNWQSDFIICRGFQSFPWKYENLTKFLEYTVANP